MSTCIEPGDYGLVSIYFEDGRYEYEDDEWICYCSDNKCKRGSPRSKNRCVEGAECEDCCCGLEAILFGEDGAEYQLPFWCLSPIVDDVVPAVRAVTGPSVYLVQMMPEEAPKQLKVGFSSKLQERLKSYRTACPQARLIAAKQADPSTEGRLLFLFKRQFAQVGGEVFKVDTVESAIKLFERVVAEAVAP